MTKYQAFKFKRQYDEVPLLAANEVSDFEIDQVLAAKKHSDGWTIQGRIHEKDGFYYVKGFTAFHMDYGSVQVVGNSVHATTFDTFLTFSLSHPFITNARANHLRLTSQDTHSGLTAPQSVL